MLTLFKGGNYSRTETIYRNTVAISDWFIQLIDQTHFPHTLLPLFRAQDKKYNNVRTRIMNISLYISFLLFISDVHKKHVMNVWRHLKATNLFPLMTVMANAKTAIFVTQI